MTNKSLHSSWHDVVRTLAMTVGSPSVDRRSTMLKLLSVLVLILTIGVGQVWGEDASISSFSATSGNIVSGVITYSSTKVSTNGPEVSGTQLKLYRKGKSGGLGDYVTVTAVSPAKITSITFTLSSSLGYSYQVDAASAVTGTNSSIAISSINASSVKFQNNSSSQMFVTGISLTYSTGSSKTLSSISVSTAPTKKKYVAGETFDPTGLIITRNYSSGSPDTYTYASHTSEFSFTPSTSTALTTSNTSVSITYGGKSTSQAINVYNVTMQARDEDGNTIPAGGPGAPTRTGNSISPAADANNYVFKQWQVTNASLGSGESTKSNTITNPTGAVTVTAVYYKPITITYKANGQNFTTQTYGHGGTLAFPASGPNGDTYSCTGKTFVGWVAEANKDYSHATTAPTYATAGGSVTTGATYYAVFATATPSTDYKQITAEADLTASAKYLIVGNSSTTYNALPVDKATDLTSVSPSSSTISKPNADLIWTLEGTADSWKIKSTSNNKYLQISGGSLTFETSTSLTFSVSVNSSKFTFTSSASSGNKVLSYYHSQTKFNAYSSANTVYIYKQKINYANYETNCCTPLGSINGSFNRTQSCPIM